VSTPIGPYTPIVRVGPWLVCSGQLGLQSPVPGGPGADGVATTPAPVALVEGGVVEQLVQALANGERLLRGKGALLADVFKTTVFLTDMDDYPAVNEAYAGVFGQHRPARSVVAVAGLPMGALVEVELWAYCP
jgi:2-iminobutanoate/2-iminopropanoate deaminase